MEERRRGGFRVKPSFGQVLGYIQEGEPLTLDLPKRNASIYTSSHWYLDDYPNAPEPISEAPLPHTTLNPEQLTRATMGSPSLARPEFTRPSFLPDSDDGGSDPGQALRNDGLDPPRPPTLGGRMRESGIQAAEAIVAGGAAGAAAAVRSVSENQTMLALRGGGDWLDRTLRIPRRPPGLAPPPDEVPAPQIIGRPSEVEPLLERAGQRAAEVERQAAQDIERFASQQVAEAEATEGFASAAEVAAAGAETAAAVETGGALTALGEGALAVAGAAGAATGGLVAAAAVVGTAWAIEGGVNAASHLLGWGAETGGGTDSDASRPSRATDVQTLNGMQESGAIDHFFAQQLRRQPQVYRIDTDSESEPQAQPRQQIRARPIRRQGQGRQQPTPFGINQVPIPVSSGSERSRISRQSRGDRGPLATPSFDALRTASEPEAA